VIQRLQLRNFKSWCEADIEFGSITIFFGANSSGKTALLQFLLLLKQTVEHPDPTIPLFWGMSTVPSNWAATWTRFIATPLNAS
jgi:predicted ATP-dependent endonuclease of OLD family